MLNFVNADRIFEDECTTIEVYKARTKNIVAAAIQGFNGIIILIFTPQLTYFL